MNKCSCGEQIPFYASACAKCEQAWREGVKLEESKYTKEQLASVRKDA